MDEATRHSLVQLLGGAMSDISEDCWSAGWLTGGEDFIPELCRRAVATGLPQKFGQGYVTAERARGLVYLAEHIGCWANWDPNADEYVPHQPVTRRQ